MYGLATVVTVANVTIWSQPLSLYCAVVTVETVTTDGIKGMSHRNRYEEPLEAWLAGLGPEKPANLRNLEVRLPGWQRQVDERKAELRRRIDAGDNVRYWRSKLQEIEELEDEQRYGADGRIGGLTGLPPLRKPKAPKVQKTKITDPVTVDRNMSALQQELREAKARIAELEAQIGNRARYDRTCEHCDRQFTSESPRARFHSNACRQAAYRERRNA
jgi:hypothetical protein